MKSLLLNKLLYLEMKLINLKKRPKKELKKEKKNVKSSWFDWLINYILKPIK